MHKFACPSCGNRIYFENRACLSCGSAVGFSSRELEMIALVPDAETAAGAVQLYRRFDRRKAAPVRYCANSAHGVCNWLTIADDSNGLCAACDLNRMIPNLSERGSIDKWAEFERAKKRLLYGLMRFGLPTSTSGPNGRLTFDFARDVMTGHLDGVITVDMLEADAVERTKLRERLAEPYRSLLGHLRHESGHFYWNVLVEGGGHIQEFRNLFGDETQNYQHALDRHYASGAPNDWPRRYVSAYASMHPWEDWAETWAHYLHIVETLDTAEAEGMEPRAAGFTIGSIWSFAKYDIYREESFASLMQRWLPLAIAMNGLSRSMGHDDFYPFVIPAPAYDKLEFIHRVIRER